jgi:hypothetical protein
MRKKTRPLPSIRITVLLLMLFYVSSACHPGMMLLGLWQSTDGDGSLEFYRDGAVVIIGPLGLVKTEKYWIKDGNHIDITGLDLGGRTGEQILKYHFQGDQLFLTLEDTEGAITREYTRSR